MSWRNVWMAAVLSAGLAISMGACGGGDDDEGGAGGTGGAGGAGGAGGSGSNTNSVVGTWNAQFDDGGGTVFWVFDEDGSWDWFDDAALQARHLGGSYTQNGNAITGDCVNPGVGNCNIEVTIGGDGQTLDIDFIEHWHSPSKHVGITGTRID